VYDRVCRDCETRYTPPTPIWMAVVGLFVGMVILLVGAAIGTFAIVDGVGQRPQDLDFDELILTTVGATVATVSLVAIGGTAVITSVQHFRKGNDENE
jgi:RsiW-degrading membrane proteinase PrsW (M82 family)